MQEIADWLRIPLGQSEDAELSHIITRGRAAAEDFTGRIALPQTWEQILDSPAEMIRLLREPVSSITKIEYISSYTDDTWVQLDSTTYMTSGPFIRPRLQWWPITREWQSFKITFVAGYSDATKIPDGYLQAMKHLIANFWEHRVDEDQRSAGVEGMLVKDIPFGAREQLRRYKIWIL